MPKPVTTYQQPVTRDKGFTLIELLVVIAIIGILAALGTLTYSDSQQKSRDSKRKADLESIRKAIELAKQDTQSIYSYPSCGSASPWTTPCGITNTSTTPNLSPTYIKNVPTDPKTGANYNYNPGPTANCATGTCTNFSLVACLENTKDLQRDETNGGSNDLTSCPASSNTKSYTLKNL